MKNFFLPCLVVAMSLLSLPVLAQDKADTTAKLGLAGDGLDLYATLDLFQNSKTIEAFEKSLNALIAFALTSPMPSIFSNNCCFALKIFSAEPNSCARIFA